MAFLSPRLPQHQHGGTCLPSAPLGCLLKVSGASSPPVPVFLSLYFSSFVGEKEQPVTDGFQAVPPTRKRMNVVSSQAT